MLYASSVCIKWMVSVGLDVKLGMRDVKVSGGQLLINFIILWHVVSNWDKKHFSCL